MTFMIIPDKPELVYPLILSLSLGDPFLGEVRRKGYDARSVFVIGSIFILAIWLSCAYFIDTKVWICLIIAPICVAAEWPRLRWIDDNATMLLIPLSVVILLVPWL